jgi:AraC-like DNA-binding protein
VLIGAGLDHLAAFQAAGLHPDVAETPGSFVTGEQELAFELKFVELTAGRTDLWVKAGYGYFLASFGTQGLALTTSPTLEHFVRASTATDLAYAMIESTPIINSQGVITGLRLEHTGAPPELVAFSVYRDVIGTLRSLMMISMKDPFPLTVAQLPLNEVSPELAKILAAPVVLGASAVGLEWDEGLSTEPLPFGDSFQHETYLREAKEKLRQFRLEQDWARSVVDAMKTTVDKGVLATDVAAALNTSARTLQRRLEENGTTFRQLRDQARFELATDMLATTNASVSEISRRLGYEEASSFTLAFKRWSGRTPSQYRFSPPARN